MSYFDFISKVNYKGKDTKNPFAFRYYDAEKVIMGKKMKDIADERGVNPSTITRQIHRAKEKIIHIAKYYQAEK